jgi:hypothetical protein
MANDMKSFFADLFSVRSLLSLIVGAFAAGGVYAALQGDIRAARIADQTNHTSAMTAIASTRDLTIGAIDSARRERSLQIDNIAHRVAALEGQQRSLNEIAQLFAALKAEVAALNATTTDLKQEVRALRSK